MFLNSSVGAQESALADHAGALRGDQISDCELHVVILEG